MSPLIEPFTIHPLLTISTTRLLPGDVLPGPSSFIVQKNIQPTPVVTKQATKHYPQPNGMKSRQEVRPRRGYRDRFTEDRGPMRYGCVKDRESPLPSPVDLDALDRNHLFEVVATQLCEAAESNSTADKEGDCDSPFYDAYGHSALHTLSEPFRFFSTTISSMVRYLRKLDSAYRTKHC